MPDLDSLQMGEASPGSRETCSSTGTGPPTFACSREAATVASTAVSSKSRSSPSASEIHRRMPSKTHGMAGAQEGTRLGKAGPLQEALGKAPGTGCHCREVVQMLAWRSVRCGHSLGGGRERVHASGRSRGVVDDQGGTST